jgi:hypothetical protein
VIKQFKSVTHYRTERRTDGMENAMAVDVKEAVALASSYLRELVPTAADLRLEEVEIIDATTNSREQWEITLSYELLNDAADVGPPGTGVGSLFQLGGALPRKPRYFRVFRIEVNSGRVRSMKIRQDK